MKDDYAEKLLELNSAGPCGGCGGPLYRKGDSLDGRPRTRYCSKPCAAGQGLHCLDCGIPLTSAGGRVDGQGRCFGCSVIHRREVHRRWVLDSFRDWIARYGEAPCANDWNLAQAKVSWSDTERIRQLEERHRERQWPHSGASIRSHFGSWSGLFEAAGVEPRPRHAAGTGQETRDRRERVLEKWERGLTLREICRDLGLTPHIVASDVAVLQGEGRASKRKKGRRLSLTKDTRRAIYEARRQGLVYREICERFGVSRSTARRVVQREAVRRDNPSGTNRSADAACNNSGDGS